MSIKGSTPAWNWFVEASPGQGKKQTSESPENKLTCVYSFSPTFSGIYSVKMPVQLDGSYRVIANQVGAGGRWAMVRIGLETTITHREQRHTRVHTIFEERVTKGSEAGPFKDVFHFTSDVDLWSGITREETVNSLTVVSTRVVLLASAKWKGSRAELDFRPVGRAGIKFGPCAVTLEVPKPRPGEQRPPVNAAGGR